MYSASQYSGCLEQDVLMQSGGAEVLEVMSQPQCVALVC